MSDFRGFLVGLANLFLFVIVVIIPSMTFLVIGSLTGRFGEFGFGLGLLGAFAALAVALPLATMLAIFIDIREQLVKLNENTGHGIFSSNTSTTNKISARDAPATPVVKVQVSEADAMKKWFLATYNKAINADDANALIKAREAGSFLTAVERLRATL